jgi:iron(III) transport system ATP-binding protein
VSRIVLTVDQVVHRYGEQSTLQGVSLSLEEGKIGCLLGPSGCGKTTLLRCIAGFELVEEGSIVVNQRLVSSVTTYVPPERRRIGVVFQDYALFPHMTVAQNIEFGIRHLAEQERREKVRKLLHSVALDAFRLRYPGELSGGQQQRVALARALAPEPDLLLLDEPFSNLDPALRDRMKHELKVLLQHFGVTALIVTHNQDEAFDMADEIGVMAHGRIIQWGSAYDLYHRPTSRTVAEFLGMGAFLPADITDDGCLVSELGELVCTEDIKHLRGQTVTVLLRPDDIVHDDGASFRAIVRRVAFRGMYRVYHLGLPSGAEIHCFTSSHHEVHEVGSEIGIRLDLKHAVILLNEFSLVEETDQQHLPPTTLQNGS